MSWKCEFVGGATTALVAHVRKHYKKSAINGNFLTIMQSSGMGKSRLLDEISKSAFTIPVSLREMGSQAGTKALYQDPQQTSGGVEIHTASKKLVDTVIARMNSSEQQEFATAPIIGGLRRPDKSLRVSGGACEVIPPFTELGFDQSMKDRKIRDDGRTTLEDVSMIEFMANFGRPLFGSRLRITEDPYECLLFAQMKLLYTLDDFSVDQGDRGEFLCMQLLIQARDDVVYAEDRMSASEFDFDDTDGRTPLIFSVTEFFNALFHADVAGDLPSRAHPKHRGQTFGSLFTTAKMSFNHFVKGHELAAESLVPAAARSAGLLCANRQFGIDGLMVFTYFDTRLQRSNIGLILWQSNNDPRITHKFQRSLFDAMDPFELNLLFPDGELIPIIRIVFALAAIEEPCLIDRAEEAEDFGSRFTTFDYWCTGIHSSVLKPVLEKGQHV
ncbi:hypothetical protein H0H81_010496 [Sphagnurus paluster]|uniref:Uncharacterized protein n=1 Tax=Sphagnurus paluster TaxID=117069 RepID=A0A9P7FQZ0_9AGAR|nr:hypothetical protein H0H81_010496 [Sphagnurus paluster]